MHVHFKPKEPDFATAPNREFELASQVNDLVVLLGTVELALTAPTLVDASRLFDAGIEFVGYAVREIRKRMQDLGESLDGPFNEKSRLEVRGVGLRYQIYRDARDEWLACGVNGNWPENHPSSDRFNDETDRFTAYPCETLAGAQLKIRLLRDDKDLFDNVMLGGDEHTFRKLLSSIAGPSAEPHEVGEQG